MRQRKNRNEYARQYYAKNKARINEKRRSIGRDREKESERNAAYYQRNRARIIERVCAAYVRHPRPKQTPEQIAEAAELRREKGKAHHFANHEKRLQQKREWAAKNRAKGAAYRAKRRALKLQSTPAWANEFFMAEAHDIARTRTRVTGIRWEVDHIVPLDSSIVCGLHVECNLQVIPRSFNRSKGNRSWPHMPAEKV